MGDKAKRATKRYSDSVKEQAYVMHTCGSSPYEISRTLNVPRQTVSGWLKAKKESAPDEFEELRRQAQRGFVEKATDIIDKGLKLVEDRFDAAIDDNERFDKALKSLLDLVMKPGDEGLNRDDYTEIMGAVKTIASVKVIKLSELTTAIGTIYDKRALAKGEATERHEITADEKALMAGVENIYKRIGDRIGGGDNK